MPFRIAPAAISKINKPAVRRKLSEELDLVEHSIVRIIKANIWNGPMTTFGALIAIQKATDLDFLDMLEEAKPKDMPVSTFSVMRRLRDEKKH